MPIKRSIIAGSAVVVSVLLLAACGNATSVTTTKGNTDGVSPNKIVVGGLASLTGPVTGDFAPIYQGVQAYFDMVNAQGGVNGRKIDFAYKLDDQSDPSLDSQLARTLVDQDHVFAVVGAATPSFAGAGYLASNDVPTFGLDVNPNSEWAAGPSLYGEDGSYQSFTSPQLQAAYLAEKLNAKNVAVLALDVSQSQQGCQGAINAFKRYGINLAYTNLDIPLLGTGLHAAVTRMASDHVDMVVSCMDSSANISLSGILQQDGLSNVKQLWYNGYDQQLLDKYPSQMNGVYFLLLNLPFEAARLYPGTYPGLDAFIKMMSRYKPGRPLSQPALAGWVNADLFVKGLRMIGKDVTRTRLVSALNSISDFTAGGILAPVDWKVSHGPNTSPYNCTSFIQAQGTRFVPVFTTPASGNAPASVFSCFPATPPDHGPIHRIVPLPAGVPPYISSTNDLARVRGSS
jgi:ABC-type branched-subunit amino acid transport system substrate-binding protein